MSIKTAALMAALAYLVKALYAAYVFVDGLLDSHIRDLMRQQITTKITIYGIIVGMIQTLGLGLFFYTLYRHGEEGKVSLRSATRIALVTTILGFAYSLSQQLFYLFDNIWYMSTMASLLPSYAATTGLIIFLWVLLRKQRS